jgi:RNA polymerase sigma-70 factor (ECF subfamily)
VAGDIPTNSLVNRGRDPDFTTTDWSLVLAVMDTAPARAFDALEKLCARYWFPIYAFIRRNGHNAHQAEDLTQSFFQFVIERQMLPRAQRDRGRFRNFILASLANFLHNHHDRVSAAKRGGLHVILSLDETHAEEILAQEPENTRTPDYSFERRWAVTLIRRVMENLRAEHAERGRLAVFDALQPHLTCEPAPGDYERLAAQLDMETGALKVALHRLRRRFGELLRKEVASTVAQPDEVEEEIRHLLAVLAQD